MEGERSDSSNVELTIRRHGSHRRNAGLWWDVRCAIRRVMGPSSVRVLHSRYAGSAGEGGGFSDSVFSFLYVNKGRDIMLTYNLIY